MDKENQEIAALFLLIDGDGHHRMNESQIVDKIWDLILSNDAVAFKRSKNLMPGDIELIVIEVLPEE